MSRLSIYVLGERSPQPAGGSYPVQHLLTTNKGKVYVEGPVEAERLKQMDFLETLTNFRPAAQQKKALVTLAGDMDGMVFIARLESTVLGYITFHDPDFPWWRHTGLEELMELGGLEVAPQWRGSGISTQLFKSLFRNEDFLFFEDRIVMNIQTLHCWDLCHATQSPWQYRNMMQKMLERFDFQVAKTDDPEIREHPANLLMVRLGKNVSEEARAFFFDLCTSRSRRKK